jgi:hypothetical protein
MLTDHSKYPKMLLLEELKKNVSIEEDLFSQMILNDRDFGLMKGVDLFSNIVNLLCWFHLPRRQKCCAKCKQNMS